MEQALLNQYVPYSQEAEEAVIGAVLINPTSFFSVASFLNAEDFFILRHQHVWQALLRLNERGDDIDYVSVGQELKNIGKLEEIGGYAYITQLITNTPTSIHAEVYGRLVERAAVRRRLLSAADRIKLLALDEELTVERVMDEAETELFGVSERQLSRELVPMREALSQYYDHLEGLMQAGAETIGLPTGFKDLNKLLGGLQKSDLLVFAGRPGMGKTSWLLSVALNVARLDRRVLIFTMEMGVDQIVQRMVSMESAINSQKLRVGNLTQQERSKFHQVVDNLSHFRIFIDDTPAMTPLQMRSKCFRLMREHGIDLVILDYMQLMNAGGFYENNRVQEISYISRSMKELARELNIPIISAAQLSRAVEQRQDKRPVLSDLRESGCLAGESRVYLPDSGCYVPIRELCGRTGFRVMSLNTETWKLEAGIVTNAFCTGVKPVYRLTTRLGRSLRATANHKFLTIHGWKRLDDLTESDHIALPRRLDGPTDQTMSDAELALLGHLIGDGCTLPTHAIQYTTREEDLAQIVAELAAEVFGDEVRPCVHEEPGRSWYQVFIPPTRHLTHGVRNPVRVWLEGLGVFGLRSHEKRVPADVFQQPQAAIALFLRHLWATDGCVRMKSVTNGHYPNIYYATSSKDLAFDVQSLLLRIGINAVCRRIPQNGNGRDQYHVNVTGKADIEKFVSVIGAVGGYKLGDIEALREYMSQRSGSSKRDYIPSEVWLKHVLPISELKQLNLRTIQTQIGMSRYTADVVVAKNISRESATQLGEIIQSQTIIDLAASDVYWDQIASIQPDGEAEVYDLTVENNHDFISDNLVVSNSIEQDADVVMFLYRDEVYNEATEFPNQAEVIVAKHRNGPTGTISLYFDKSLTKFLNAAERSIDLSHI